MGYYKIKNLTGGFSKRDMNKDKVLNIDLFNKFEKTTYKLNVNDTLYLNLTLIPTPIHVLRMKKFISIVEISKNEFEKQNKKTIQEKLLKNNVSLSVPQNVTIKPETTNVVSSDSLVENEENEGETTYLTKKNKKNIIQK